MFPRMAAGWRTTPLDALPIDHGALGLQRLRDHPAAEEGMLQMQLVDPVHQRVCREKPGQGGQDDVT